jgi:hypothetical protein
VRWYEWTSLIVVPLFAVLIFAALFGGVIPCRHRCYWCWEPLAPAAEVVRGHGAD